MTALTKFAPGSFAELTVFADQIAQTSFIPAAYKGKSGDIIAAVMMGDELGLSPMQSLQNISVINGRPTVWGDAMIALAQGHPSVLSVKEWIDCPDSADAVAYCLVRREVRGEVVETQRSFSVPDAKRANLWMNQKKHPWIQYPMRMLQMRARSWALRDSCSDILKGISQREEVQDYDVAPAVPEKVMDALAMPAPAHVVEVQAAPQALGEVRLKESFRDTEKKEAERMLKRFDNAVGRFGECGITAKQLLDSSRVADSSAIREKHIKALTRAFAKVKKGQYPKGLEPATAACDSPIPEAPVKGMAGVEPC